ncbi:MAG: sugar transferase [Planctomycetota bacterium]
MKQRGSRLRVKRSVDLLASSAGMLVLSPVMACTALALRASVGSPVLFRQVRPGLGGRGFELLKFRTMSEARDPRGELLPDEARLTRVGRIVRELSLDELPQLWNVLKGDMSLVGPRPLLVRYLQRYSPEQARRHEVLPGITGWSQVNGRNALSWDEKLSLDVWYVDNWSLGLDLRILASTVLRVLGREGIRREGYATTPEFLGSGGAGA